MALPEYPERAAIQYATIRNVCYPDRTSADVSDSFDRITGRGGTVLQTDGRRLTKINTDRINSNRDAEIILGHLTHEAAHTGHGGSWGKGVSSHPPEYWEEFARVARILLTNDTAWAAVQTVFDRDLDRHRFKYRLLQELSTNQVDKRQQTEEECKATFAENIGFSTYECFDNVYAGHGEADTRFPDTPYSIKLRNVSETYRPAVDFTDDELYEFAQKVGFEDENGYLLVPAPIVFVDGGDDVLTAPDGGEPRDEVWKKANIEDVKYIKPQAPATIEKTLALQDRLGWGCWVTDARVLEDGHKPVGGYGTDFDWDGTRQHQRRARSIRDVLTNS